MSITGPGSATAAHVLAITNMETKLDQLSRQLGTGQKAAVYSDLGAQAGISVGLDAQLAALNGYDNTNTTVNTTLSIAQSTLSQIATVGSDVKHAVSRQGGFTLGNNGQTTIQSAAASQLDQLLSLLNTQVGDNYLFSGSAPNQPSVATSSQILNGSGAQAGLTQVISERNQADLGAGSPPLGRLVIPPAVGSTVAVSEDVAGSPFGFKLAGVSTGLTGANVTGPSGSPSTITITLGSNPNPGDTIQFSFTLPDQTTATLTLQATTASPPGPNQFTIGANPAATANNLQGALTTAVGTLAQTSLRAASTMVASNNFFTSDPPLRVAGPPFATATALQAGTPANTVFWYTGENGATPARQTATALVAPSMTIAYGMRANEQAIASMVANVAALAATTYSPSDPNAPASYQTLSQDVVANLDGQSGSQSVSDIEADIAAAQTTAQDAATVNKQTQATLAAMQQQIQGVDQYQIGTQILALQTSLQASLSATARLSQVSLVNYL